MHQRTQVISAATSNEPRKNIARREGPGDGIFGLARRRQRALPLLPDASVQCIITSPPYWRLRVSVLAWH